MRRRASRAAEGCSGVRTSRTFATTPDGYPFRVLTAMLFGWPPPAPWSSARSSARAGPAARGDRRPAGVRQRRAHLGAGVRALRGGLRARRRGALRARPARRRGGLRRRRHARSTATSPGSPGPEQREVAAGRARAAAWASRCWPRSRSTACPRTSRSACRWSSGASLTLLVAIFFSNLPESLVGARRHARARAAARARSWCTWVACAVLLAARGRRSGAGSPSALSDAGPRGRARLRRRSGPRFARRHADARGVRARPAAQRLRDRRRVLPVVRARCLAGQTTPSPTPTRHAGLDAGATSQKEQGRARAWTGAAVLMLVAG